MRCEGEREVEKRYGGRCSKMKRRGKEGEIKGRDGNGGRKGVQDGRKISG